MFLKQIQNRPAEGMMSIAFDKMHQAGHAVPEIMHLFRFKKQSTDHLVRFTEEVMRGPSPLSRGMRELIGTFVSTRNQCSFCSCAHAPVAARWLGQDLVNEVLRDFERSRLDRAHKELFRFVAKVTQNAAQVRASDVNKLKELGWSEEAIYDALTVASLFKFYNTWNNGSGVQTMTASDYLGSSDRLVTMGYCMDFSWKAILKILWVGRREVTLSDLRALVKIVFQKLCGRALPAAAEASSQEPQVCRAEPVTAVTPASLDLGSPASS